MTLLIHDRLSYVLVGDTLRGCGVDTRLGIREEGAYPVTRTDPIGMMSKIEAELKVFNEKKKKNNKKFETLR